MRTIDFLKSNFRFLTFGLTLTFFSSFGQSFFYGLFNQDMRETFGISNTAFGSFYGIINILSAMSLMYFGRFIDTVPLHKYTICVFIVLISGCFLMSQAPILPVFLCALFLTRFGGQGLMIHTNSTSMGRYFNETRGRALAITIVGVHLGSLLLPSLVVFMKKHMEWQQSWLAFTVFIAFIILPFAMWLLKDHHIRHKVWEDGEKQKDADNKASNTHASDWTSGMVLKDARFFMIIPTLLINPIIGTGIFFYIQNVADAKGWAMETVAIAFGANAISTITFTLLGGLLVDALTAKRLFVFLPIPMTIALLILTLFSQIQVAFIFMILMGLSVGLFSAASGSIWAELYGTRYLGSIRALFGMVMVFSTALMPPLMGYLFDEGVALETLTLGLMIYVISAALLSSPISIKAWVKSLKDDA